MQQDLPGRHDRHKQSGVVLLADALEALDQFGLEPAVDPVAAERSYRRPHPIGWHFQHGWGACKLRFPVRQLIVEQAGVDLVVLPRRIVDILQRQRRDIGLRVACQRRIEADEIPEQDRQRPAVGDDVVQADGDEVDVRRDPHREQAGQRAVDKVELRSDQRSRHAPSFSLAIALELFSQIDGLN